MIIDEPIHQPIQPAEFGHRLAGVGFRVDKMLEPINDHAELRAPVPHVIVADHLVAEESQHAVERRADDRRADVADVHGLGHVGRRIVDHDRAGFGHRRHAEPFVPQCELQLVDDPLVFEPQIDETRAGDFSGLTKTVEMHTGDDFDRHVARIAAQAFA